jgi:hypothetical protein
MEEQGEGKAIREKRKKVIIDKDSNEQGKGKEITFPFFFAGLFISNNTKTTAR